MVWAVANLHFSSHYTNVKGFLPYKPQFYSPGLEDPYEDSDANLMSGRRRRHIFPG
jgi:hypothetical protein